MDITNTGVRLEYEMTSFAFKEALLESSNIKSFCNLYNLENGVIWGNYMTLEHNWSCLDGSLEEMPNSPPKLGFFSNDISNSEGVYNSDCYVQIGSGENSTTPGITLEFEDDHPLEIEVKFYTGYASNPVLTSSKKFEVSSNKVSFIYSVESFTICRVYITKTLPYRHTKINTIKMGILYNWEDDKLLECSLVEEIDFTGGKLPVNTLSFKLLDEDHQFNPGNENGIFKNIMKRQPVQLIENIRGVLTKMGKFYVDTWEYSDDSVTISCVDVIGLLSTTPYFGSSVYSYNDDSSITADNLVSDILGSCYVKNYELQESLHNIKMFGSIPPTDGREALRQVAFALRATVKVDGSGKLLIYVPERKIVSYINSDRKVSTVPKRKQLVSEVSIETSEYYSDSSSELEDIESKTYEPGFYTLDFKDPYYSYNITGVDEDPTSPIYGVSIHTYHIFLGLSKKSDVTIKGIKYKNTKNTTSLRKDITKGEFPEKEDYSCSMMANNNKDLVVSKIKDIQEYYSFRLELNVQFFRDNENIGDWVVVSNPDIEDSKYIAGLEKMETDLLGGFVTTATLVAYYDHSDNYYYTGDELYPTDNFIV